MYQLNLMYIVASLSCSLETCVSNSLVLFLYNYSVQLIMTRYFCVFHHHKYALRDLAFPCLHLLLHLQLSIVCCWLVFLRTTREGSVFTGVYQSFCSQSASWLLSYGAVGTHPTGMLSCLCYCFI